MINIDRVIGRLMQLMQNTHTASALRRGSEYGKTELVFRHGLRTRESEEHTAQGYLLEGSGIETRVTF